MPQNEEQPLVLNVEDFDPFVGGEVRFAGSDIALTLDHVVCKRGPIAEGMTRVPFILIFRGPKSRDPQFRDLLPEGLHAATFANAATHVMHVAPIQTRPADGQHYQAAFN